MRAKLDPDRVVWLPLLAGLVLLSVFGWAFGEVLDGVLEREELAIVDSPVAGWLARHRVSWLTAALQLVTQLGGLAVIVPVAAIVAGVAIARMRRCNVALFLAVVIGGSWALTTLVKFAVARPRPRVGEIVAVYTGYAFPSGHSSQAVAAYGALALLATLFVRRRGLRLAAWVAAGLIVVLVGLSRLYLGAHWLSDVLGGYALGAAWLTAVWVAMTYRRVRRRRPVATSANRPARPAQRSAAR